LRSVGTEEQRFVVLSFVGRGLNAKDIHKEMFPVYGGKCLSRRKVYNWVEKFSEGRSKVSDDETEVLKWLRQQSRDFYAVSFEALVKRWDKCFSVGGEHVEE
jgi:transposase